MRDTKSSSTQRQLRELKNAEKRGREAGHRETLKRLKPELDELDSLHTTIDDLRTETTQLRKELKALKAEKADMKKALRKELREEHQEEVIKAENRGRRLGKTDALKELTPKGTYSAIYDRGRVAERKRLRAETKNDLKVEYAEPKKPHHTLWLNAYADGSVNLFQTKQAADESSSLMRMARIKIYWQEGQMDE